MKAHTPAESPNGRSEITSIVLKGSIKAGSFILVLALILFISSGRLDWMMAWVYIGVILINSAVMFLVLDPELIAERSQIKEGSKRADIVLAILMARVGPMVTLVLAGLGVRYGWSPRLPLALQITSFGFAILSLLLVNWAVMSNKFFSGVNTSTERRVGQ